MAKPYLAELVSLKPNNDLYARWVKYALTFDKSEIQFIIDNGLVYQANAIKSMISEIIAGGAAPDGLSEKLDKIVELTKLKSSQIRK